MSAMDLFSRSNVARTNRFSGFLGGLTKRFQQYQTYQQTLEELERLSDRELADLGISRIQIRAVAYRAAYDG